MRLFLVRHGQTLSNVNLELDTGAPGRPLTDTGWEQAHSLVERMSGIGLDAMVASNLTRTQETASPLAASRDMEPEIDEGIREILAGELEMNSDMESIQIYHSVVEEWSRGNLDVRMPGAETGHDVMGRYDEVVRSVRRIAGEHGAAALFSHGAVIRTWARYSAVNVDFDRFGIVENTGIVELDDAGGDWRIVRWMADVPGADDASLQP